MKSKLIAIVGGSGAGKTWLAERLRAKFGSAAARLSQDDFYCDRSGLPGGSWTGVNFDHPSAIDWHLFRSVLRDCRNGRPTQIPRYDFSTHARLGLPKPFVPARLVFVEGLWLLATPEIADMFAQTIYLYCPEKLRLERRLERDVLERGRTPESVREQFRLTVTPMHNRHVAPQAQCADMVLREPLDDTDFHKLLKTLRDRFSGREPVSHAARPSLVPMEF